MEGFKAPPLIHKEMAFEDYKKVIRITDRNDLSGELSYELLYVSDETYDSKTPREIYEAIPKINRLPVSGDKMYFLNDVVIPRFKIKKFCEETGAKVVKYLSSGNYVIIGKKTIEKLFTNSYNVEVDKVECLDFVNKVISSMNSLAPLWMTDLKQLIIDCDENVLINNKYSLTGWFKQNTDIGLGYSQSLTEISYDNYSRLTEIMSLTCDIVEEDTILLDLNKNTVMDREIFENIQKLFQSPDDENIKIAMELMSNCDFSKSAPYLLLLLKDFHKEIYASSTKNHVNFKGMLNYFNLHVNDTYRMNLDSVLKILLQKKIFYKSSMQMLKDMVLEDMPSATYYKTTDIVFIDENDEEIEIIDDTPPPPVFQQAFEDILIQQIQDETIRLVQVGFDLDSVIWDELSEVMRYFQETGHSKFRDKILEVRHSVESAEVLLPIIKYLDEKYEYQLATLLTQSYLSLPHEI